MKDFLTKIFGIKRIYNLFSRTIRLPLHPSVLINSSIIRGTCLINEGSKILKGVELIGRKKIIIGRYTSISGPNTTVYSGLNNIEIGSFCSIARGVDMQEFNHFTKRASTYFMLQNVFGERSADITSKGPIKIGSDVWIGCQSVILSGVTVGDGAIIAANSVVSMSVPPYSIVGGVPAKVIGSRFSPEIIEQMLTLRWWDWSIDKIKRNKEFFSEEVTLSSFENLRD